MAPRRGVLARFSVSLGPAPNVWLASIQRRGAPRFAARHDHTPLFNARRPRLPRSARPQPIPRLASRLQDDSAKASHAWLYELGPAQLRPSPSHPAIGLLYVNAKHQSGLEPHSRQGGDGASGPLRDWHAMGTSTLRCRTRGGGRTQARQGTGGARKMVELGQGKGPSMGPRKDGSRAVAERLRARKRARRGARGITRVAKPRGTAIGVIVSWSIAGVGRMPQSGCVASGGRSQAAVHGGKRA